jgi:phosphatidylserine decarboxylase
MFTKYGYNLIGIALIISFVLIALGIYLNNTPTRIVLFLLAILISRFTLNFFRDPERTVPADNNIVVSPADGRILFIKDVDGTPFIEGKAKQISIFMSPLNVHVNRIPIDGLVTHVKYHRVNSWLLMMIRPVQIMNVLSSLLNQDSGMSSLRR